MNNPELDDDAVARSAVRRAEQVLAATVRHDSEAGLADLHQRLARLNPRHTPSPRRPRRAGGPNRGLVANLIGVILGVVVSIGLSYMMLRSDTRSSASVGGLPAIVATSPATSEPGASTSLGQDLHYQLKITVLNSRTVEVVTQSSGQAVPGLTYWFMVEVDQGNGNIHYYPRRKLAADSESFDLAFPAAAGTTYLRLGRVYALDAEQSQQAEIRLARQVSTQTEDFFDTPTGTPVSSLVALSSGAPAASSEKATPSG